MRKEVIGRAVFRIEKTRDYTVMSNHHLRNTNLEDDYGMVDGVINNDHRGEEIEKAAYLHYSENLKIFYKTLELLVSIIG